MSQKKHKKRHSQSTINAKRQANQAKLADEKDRMQKRMDPTARNLLLGDLVFLAICQLLYNNGMISETFSTISSIIGLILLVQIFQSAGTWLGTKCDKRLRNRS